MRACIYLLVLSFLLSGCENSPTGTSPEYPKRIGTWNILSEHNAEWVGTTSKSLSESTLSATDTIEIDQPGDRGLELYQEADKDTTGDFNLSFIDSSITTSTSRFDSLDSYNITFSNPNFNLRRISVGGKQWVKTQDRLVADMDMGVVCVSQIEPSAHIFLRLYDKSDQTLRVYKLYIQGFSDSIGHVACNQPL